MDSRLEFYNANYDAVFRRLWEVNERITLGNRSRRQCRFCGLSSPETSFRKRAHAAPECIGNRGLTTYYECDICNGYFGRTIENDLGVWLKPMRTFIRIPGKRGVPTLKDLSDEHGYRIEYTDGRIIANINEHSKIAIIDEEKNIISFKIPRGSYTPVAVYKSFVKIALSPIPETEFDPFRPTFSWILEQDHTKISMPQLFIHIKEMGPFQSDRIFAQVLRRREDDHPTPYAFLIVGFGNSIFQVMIPCPNKDRILSDKKIKFPPFPTPGGLNPERHGKPSWEKLDLSNTNQTSDEYNLSLKFESIHKSYKG